MARGLLEVRGTIDLDQFWPNGRSDADTSKVVITAPPDAFTYQPHPDAPAKITRVFDGAKVVDPKTGSRRDVIDKNGKLVVRLQGIDAPELHFRPVSELSDKRRVNGKLRTKRQKQIFLDYNEEYRQCFAESATRALGDVLATIRRRHVPCRAISRVDDPDDVFDVYGRFVGDIVVRRGSKDLNVNRWLVEQGWALPAFYTSMEEDEIRALLAAASRSLRRNARARFRQTSSGSTGTSSIVMVTRHRAVT